MHSVSKHARHCVVSYLLYSFTFSLLLVDKCLPDVAGAITALPLTFRKQKQIAITESLGVEKTGAASRGFLAPARLRAFLVCSSTQKCSSKEICAVLLSKTCSWQMNNLSPRKQTNHSNSKYHEYVCLLLCKLTS